MENYSWITPPNKCLSYVMLKTRANYVIVCLTGDGEKRSNKRAPDSSKRGLDFWGTYAQKAKKSAGNEHLTFNQGVTGSRPVRPTKAGRPSLSGSF